MPVALAFIMQWLQIGQEVYNGGTAAWNEIKAALQARGYAADTAQIDAAMAQVQDLRAENQGLADS